MPAKKRRKVASPQTSLNAAHNTPGISDYKHFVKTYLTGVAGRNNWSDAKAGVKGDIVNEIARKFNSSNTKGIYKPSHELKGANSSSHYWADLQGRPRLDLVPRGDKKYGPNPGVVAHELIHANDHQSNDPADRFNPSVWANIGTLAQTGGAAGMADFGEFNDSLGRIQDKVDPTGVFRGNYSFDQDYIKDNIQRAHGVGGDAAYQIPMSTPNTPNWLQLFQDINNVVTRVPPAGAAGAAAIPNQGFYLNVGSEFPAFMAENLTKPWAVNAGVNPLSIQEARFLHSTLGNMEAAYPGAEYPTMNKYIGQRRNSIADAYYPPPQGGVSGSGVPGAGFSRGGRITGKNLLSRFKKTH